MTQGFARRRLAETQGSVGGEGTHLSYVFTSRARMHWQVANRDPFAACFSSAFRGRLVAAPLPLAKAALR